MHDGVPHILIIDDCDGILECVTSVLQWNGFAVATSKGSMDCWELIDTLQPSLILLDKALGQEDGCTICKQIKSHTGFSAIKVIMFSAFTHVEGACLVAGADAFLEKPFDLDNLMEKVRHFIQPAGVPMAV